MADQQPSQQPGFKLPMPETRGSGAGGVSPSSPASPPAGSTVVPPTVEVDTSARDMAIAGGILLVLVIAFVFAKTAYANALVGKKVAPRSANAAGWWLFILLTSLATVTVLGFVNQARFLSLIFVAPLGVVALVSLVLMLLSSRR
jgi:hypothetical protein